MRTFKTITLLSLSFFTAAFIGCNQGTQTETSEETTVEEVVEEVTDDTTEDMTPQYALLVTHQVSDFATWKAGYDAHSTMRTTAQLEDWAIDVAKDDPNLVTVVHKAGNLEAAREFINSEELKTAAQDAGVIGEPQIAFVEMVLFNQDAAQSSRIRGIFTHEVADFTTWKTVFDEHEEARSNAGVSIVAIGRSVDNPNIVTIAAAAVDFETLEAFAGSEELKEGMAKAGVVGEPTISYKTVAFPEM